MGIELDVGELPTASESDTSNDDPQALAKLTAHIVARVGDRFSFIRKLSRHAEGQEKRAGIVSDLLSALYVLYKRNPDALETLAQGYIREVQAQRAAKRAAKQAPQNGNTPTQGVGFGEE